MIHAVWFGRRLFKDGLRLQDEFYNLVTSNTRKHYVCLLEHFPVYTVGLRDQSYTPEMENKLKELGADFQRIKRGGLITFHGPGQLVAYPILNLRDLYVDGKQVGVKHYVSLLEDVLIRVSNENGLQNVGRTSDPGVWVEENRKIAAIGIQIRNGVTSHGIALNCNTDLSWYNHIVACGLVNKTVTSLTKELGRDVTVSEILQPFVRTFSNVFQSEISFKTQVEY